MDNGTKKRLTQYLGEWHEVRIIRDSGYGRSTCSCGNSGYSVRTTCATVEDRTFTTPDDMDALRRKLVEKGDWIDFHKFSQKAWRQQNEKGRLNEEAWFSLFLFNNLSSLAGEYLVSKEK